MKLSHAITSSIGIVATALLLAGCSGGDSAAETSKAVMYTSNNETTVGVVTSAAAASDPSLKVEAVTGSSGPLLQRIKSEASAPAADVFYSAPATTFADFSEFAEPYRSPEADAIPADILDAEDRWVPTNTHVVALMANTDQIDGGKAPTSWKDLTDPKWKGKVIVADPSQSSTALTALYGASKVLGENDFTKLVENLEVTENSSNVYPAVAQGEYAVAIAYESNIYPYVAGEQAGIEMVYPEDGTFVEYDSAFVVKGAPHTAAAKQLIDVILSKEAQEENLKQSFRRPVRDDIDPTEFVDFKKLEDLTIVDIHGAEDAKGRETFLSSWAKN